MFTIKCYGKKTLKESERKEQMAFYLQGVMECDGSERERYAKIYAELAEGLKYCSDEY